LDGYREHINALEVKVCKCLLPSPGLHGSGTRIDLLELVESDGEVPELDDSYATPPIEDEGLKYSDSPLLVPGPEHRGLCCAIPCPPTPHVRLW
jgi:hypothetical protein